MSLLRASQNSQQEKAKRVQQKIKLMMKNKKMHKLTSQRDLVSQKPASIYNDFSNRKLEQVSLKYRQNIVLQNSLKDQQNFEIHSSKRLKSTNFGEDFAPLASLSLKEQPKQWTFSNKGKTHLFENQALKKTPSAQKIDNANQANKKSQVKLKRPSSVINKSTRSTTSRSRPQKRLLPQDHKAMQQKVRAIISKSFQYGIKLQKYAQQKQTNLARQQENLFSQQINILILINSCRKYYVLNVQNQEQQDHKLSLGVQKQIIEMLKKKREKQLVIVRCGNITDQISRLIQTRLTVLNKTKINL